MVGGFRTAGGVGSVAPRSDGGVAGFDVAAGLGVDPAVVVAHAVGLLLTQPHSAAASAVLLVEFGVEVEV
jgi:hypothetical protein